MSLPNLDIRFEEAVVAFWNARDRQQKKQEASGRNDAGTRGAVTGGGQMEQIEQLIVDILLKGGVPQSCIFTKSALELPGYFRPEKKWDLLAVKDEQLFCAIEFKSQVGPSFGNNFNNRVEEAIGSATDIWTAYREGRLGTGPRPHLGYFFLLEDCPEVHKPVKANEPHFKTDPAFTGASYSGRYELLCRRLVLERLYDAACLTLSPKAAPHSISHPADDQTFRRFAMEIEAVALRFGQ
ncbi:PaeR7I family type II restriction endonuclease [Armatimonas sp.]|uniref:PaeR7I family type II restriction endonuclease n=1 Tax=Armatimonas sp. TaxID=1872638 RepID=UPI0037531C86